MQNKIKLVVTDIDGTIVEMNGKLQPEIISIFDTLQKNDVKVVIATGRMFIATSEIINTLKLKTPVICYQGAMIRDEKKVYFEQNVPKQIASDIITRLRNYNSHINLYLRDRLIVENDDKYIKEYAGDRNIPYEVVDDLQTVVQDATKLLTIDDDVDKVTFIRDEMRKIYPELNIVKSTNTYCEFVSPYADKGLAIKFLAEKWNLKTDEILAIGDQDNDIEMLKVAGTGIAMGNGSENIKKIADYICPTVQEFGFAQAMEKFVL
ncbi:MAG: Cof-type HAD-IIB family hydrolase [Candidatus Gastranaerophilales bacterium]|nr:Cof-type HAD-IIB family hydrolase [Candidatus Gastranaerophilales bacterium]